MNYRVFFPKLINNHVLMEVFAKGVESLKCFALGCFTPHLKVPPLTSCNLVTIINSFMLDWVWL